MREREGRFIVLCLLILAREEERDEDEVYDFVSLLEVSFCRK